MKKKIIFVHFYFTTEDDFGSTRHIDFFNSLDKNVDVKIITAKYHHLKLKKNNKRLRNTRLNFVTIKNTKYNSFVSRLISILIFAKKGKLGEFGNMFQRQIEELLKGKRKILVYVESVFVLVLLGGMIFTISEGNTTYSHVQDQFFISREIESPEYLIEQTNKWTAND